MKRLLVCFLLLAFTSALSAQESVDGFMKLFEWVKKLDENISSIVRTENQKKLVRQLGYVQSDLDDFIENQKKLVRQLGYVQSDLDDFIEKKKEMTKDLIRHCTDSSVSISDIEKKLDEYNKEIKILTKRLEEIRKAIIFEDELYSVTEKRIVTVYQKPSLDENSRDTFPERMMVQQTIRSQSPMNGKDTLMDVTVSKNKNEWKEVDIEGLLFEIEKSLDTKSSNMEYIVNDLSKNCNLELINDENNMAIDVLTNIRNEFRKLRKKVKDFKPQ